GTAAGPGERKARDRQGGGGPGQGQVQFEDARIARVDVVVRVGGINTAVGRVGDRGVVEPVAEDDRPDRRRRPALEVGGYGDGSGAVAGRADKRQDRVLGRS